MLTSVSFLPTTVTYTYASQIFICKDRGAQNMASRVQELTLCNVIIRSLIDHRFREHGVEENIWT